MDNPHVEMELVNRAAVNELLDQDLATDIANVIEMLGDEFDRTVKAAIAQMMEEEE